MPRPTYIPDDPEIAVVETTEALFSYERGPEESMVLLPRPIKGCFNDLGIWLLHQNLWHNTRVADGLAYVSVAYSLDDLNVLAKNSSMVWTNELALICSDLAMMQHKTGLQAELRVVRDEGYHPETYEFHQDGGTYKPFMNSEDRIMCGYNDPVTECLLTGQAIARAPTMRGGHEFDKKDNVQPFRPRIGDIWRQACLGSRRPLIHRAVPIPAGNPERPWEGSRPWNPPRLLAVC